MTMSDDDTRTQRADWEIEDQAWLELERAADALTDEVS